MMQLEVVMIAEHEDSPAACRLEDLEDFEEDGELGAQSLDEGADAAAAVQPEDERSPRNMKRRSGGGLARSDSMASRTRR
jgi:hypothetical protein